MLTRHKTGRTDTICDATLSTVFQQHPAVSVGPETVALRHTAAPFAFALRHTTDHPRSHKTEQMKAQSMHDCPQFGIMGCPIINRKFCLDFKVSYLHFMRSINPKDGDSNDL